MLNRVNRRVNAINPAALVMSCLSMTYLQYVTGGQLVIDR